MNRYKTVAAYVRALLRRNEARKELARAEAGLTRAFDAMRKLRRPVPSTRPQCLCR